MNMSNVTKLILRKKNVSTMKKKRRIPRTKVKEQRNSSLAMYIYYWQRLQYTRKGKIIQ